MKQKTLANISLLPLDTIEIIKKSLKGDIFISASGIEITRSRSCGHVEAVRSCLKDLGLSELICPDPGRRRDIVEAMIIARVIEPQTRLSTTSWWHTTTLPELLEVKCKKHLSSGIYISSTPK